MHVGTVWAILNAAIHNECIIHVQIDLVNCYQYIMLHTQFVSAYLVCMITVFCAHIDEQFIHVNLQMEH